MSIVQLTSKIDKAKVYAQGSTVTRLASLSAISWQSESIEVEIIGLPLAIDDASVRVRVESSAANENVSADFVADRVIVADVRVGLSVSPPPEVSLSSLEAVIQTAKAEVDRLEDLRSAIDLEILILNELHVPDRPIGEEGKTPPPSPTGARLALANFKDEQKQLRVLEKRELQEKLRKAQEHLADLQQQQFLASNANVAKEHELRKTIIARLHVGNIQTPALPSPDNLQLVVEYFIDGARWTPTYVCRLNSATNTAAIAVRALIAQRTGEDWNGVKIELSTATPTGWCELPELPSLRLGRSQTLPRKKAWRNPPKGAELLFEDYDHQKQFQDNEQVVQLSDLTGEPMEIPTINQLIGIPKFPFFKRIVTHLERREELSFSELETLLGEVSKPASAVNDSFDDMETMMITASFSKNVAPQGGERSASPKSPMMVRSIGSQAVRMAPQADEYRGRGGDPIPEPIFDPSADIKNYGLMRLAEPSNTRQRGKLSIPNPRTLYLESLLRWQMKVNFEIETVLQTAFDRTFCNQVLPRFGSSNIRKEVGNFDFVYLGTGRIDVPSDGQYHSVALLQENAEIDIRYIVVPREDANVFRIAQLRNPLNAPLLLGLADIYVDGQYILSKTIATVPPRGQMELALGVEQSIKVARNTSFKEVRSGMSLVSFNELRHSIHIAIANRMGRVAKIEVRERIPIPQPDAKVDVSVTQVTPPWEKYEQQERNTPIKGGYRWQIEVPAGGERELIADYTIKTFVENELVNGNRREE
ncbi:DUF4139 domain-containing protein [Pseudanabaena sp. FACHB-1998]|uniref:DUF4139 domain-containing protein n=1 Tax=Pseudanabaena sp. FACHB-1998 TaxID=2692858 RepID=UPI001680EE19|nr:DUF4139 domain-containing protein [Pseudanabaena sp. FACHB-1998]MBD2179327.1 DUF4139 domain-containing protein [Pseudanabaena sp. FACHB-1998]